MKGLICFYLNLIKKLKSLYLRFRIWRLNRAYYRNQKKQNSWEEFYKDMRKRRDEAVRDAIFGLNCFGERTDEQIAEHTLQSQMDCALRDMSLVIAELHKMVTALKK